MTAIPLNQLSDRARARIAAQDPGGRKRAPGQKNPYGRSSEPEQLLLKQMRLAGLPTPDVQVKFCLERGWTFDLAFWWCMLAVEVDGGIWSGGRHILPQHYEAHCDKMNRAALDGWAVLHFTPSQVESGAAVDLIGRALNGRTPPKDGAA